MNRRDFLLFRKSAGKRIVDLSCERLYIRSLGVQLTKSAEPDSWDGDEPLRVLSESPIEELFQGLEHDLGAVDVVRVIDPRWLASKDLKERLDVILDRFRGRGGEVITA